MCYKLAADQGHSKARCGLGKVYQQGLCGGQKSDYFASKHYQIAADQGDAEAQYILGIMHANGRIALPVKQAALMQIMPLKLSILTKAL